MYVNVGMMVHVVTIGMLCEITKTYLLEILSGNAIFLCIFQLMFVLAKQMPGSTSDLLKLSNSLKNLRQVNNNKGSERGFYLLKKKCFLRMPPRDNHFCFL